MPRDLLRLSRDPWLWTGVLAAALLVLPIAVAHHLNVVDGPGHEARLAVLRDVVIAGRDSPAYKVTSFFLPNIAYDVIGLALAWLSGPEAAARIFLGATFVLTLAGAMVLGRAATGRWSLVPLAAAFVVHNLFVVQGSLNYVFGLAVVPWALALRLKLDGPRGFVPGALAAIALLFCHLFDFGLYAVMVFGFAIAEWRRRDISYSGFAARLLEFAPALFLLALMQHDPSRNLQYGHFAGKLTGILKAFTCGSVAGDVAFLAGMALFAACMVWLRARIARPLVPGLMLLAAVYLALPDELGHASYIDKRVLIAIALFLIAGLDARLPRSTGSTVLAALIAAAFVAKQGALAVLWQRMDPRIEAAAMAVDSVPRGGEIFRAECRPADTSLDVYRAHQPALTHAPAFATFDQGRFYGGIWAIPGQQPISVRPEYRAAYDLQTGIGWSVCAGKSLQKVASRIRALDDGRPHYLFVIRPAKPRSLAPENALIAAGADFELYRIGPR